ncbi:MAG: IS1595 family transposase [Betaproteobacteria bacterium]|nr:IS1595 family transposase [Betaproteobacteria bacterium]
MPKNKVQFQRGMSLPEFMDRYGTKERCEQALFAWRWPGGFVCPECGHTGCCALKGRPLFQCNGCSRQTSVTAGTVFAASKLALNVWFLAMHLITQAKNGISSMDLSRQLGISQNSAWLMKHKLMQAMLERDGARPLAGVVQIDDAYWGGRRRGFKRGRGASGKTPFVAAVETDVAGHPRRMSLNCVRGFRSKEIARWSRRKLAAGTAVHSDGLACFAAVSAAGCAHNPTVMRGPGIDRRRRVLNWVDTMLGNVKNSIHGTYHAIRPKHLPRYLAEFSYRFNRRFDLASMLARLATAAAQTPPMPYRLVKLAEAHW